MRLAGFVDDEDRPRGELGPETMLTSEQAPDQRQESSHREADLGTAKLVSLPRPREMATRRLDERLAQRGHRLVARIEAALRVAVHLPQASLAGERDEFVHGIGTGRRRTAARDDPLNRVFERPIGRFRRRRILGERRRRPAGRRRVWDFDARDVTSQHDTTLTQRHPGHNRKKCAAFRSVLFENGGGIDPVARNDVPTSFQPTFCEPATQG